MTLGALLIAFAGAVFFGLTQANAAPAPVETQSRHWINWVECETERNARLN